MKTLLITLIATFDIHQAKRDFITFLKFLLFMGAVVFIGGVLS